MAAAVQQAKKNAPNRAPENMPKQERENKGNPLANIPRAAGIAIMIVLLIASLFAGNFRALQRATPRDFLRQGDVRSIVEDRLDAAGNAMTVARRAGLDGEVYERVDNLIHAMEDAETAREISRADQDLTAAITEVIIAAGERLDSENRTMLQSAADDFAEQGSFLRQEARRFNEQAEKAEALYEKLPTKFLLSEPDVYEGL